MIKFEIDGKELEVQPGTTIIEAADNAGISIPRFCYHKKLSIAANCRMCLVEVEKAPKPMPACATPVAEGMNVKTQSSKALMAQRSVMEFLLINHPLDCPICDQGGECELQDVSMGYGEGVSEFNQGKRSVKDENIGPLIATGMTRCIHCTRCVRFGEEVAGIKELGMLGRGEESEIRTFINNSVDSEMSGNMIDVCPVGALTSKPYRFSARTWELQQYPTIAAHDPVGSHTYVHSVRNKVKRVVPRENEEINEVWLSDRDRFSYEAVHHSEKLQYPLARINGKLRRVDWEQALTLAAQYISEQVETNPRDLISLISPSSTTEEGYILQKILRNLGSNNIESRLKVAHDFDLGLSGGKLADIELADNILLVGATLRKSIPMLNHRVRKAVINGAVVNTLNPFGFDFNYDVALEDIVEPQHMLRELAAVVKQVYIQKQENIPHSLEKVSVSGLAQNIAESLSNGKNPVIIMGDIAVEHPDREELYKLIVTLKNLLGCISVVTSKGANSQGLILAGAVPHRQAAGYLVSKPGDDVKSAFERANGVGTYILFNVEPEYDCINGIQAIKKLNNAKKVIVLSTFTSDSVNSYADVVLPIASTIETSGTFVNIEHKWQSFAAACGQAKDSEVRPGWRVLCALAKLLELNADEFNFESSTVIKQEVFGLSVNSDRNKCEDVDSTTELTLSLSSKLKNHENWDDAIIATVITEQNCYSVDNFVRRAESLQQTTDAKMIHAIFVSSNLADKLSLKNRANITVASMDDLTNGLELLAIVDSKLPDNHVYLSSGSQKTISITKPYGQVVLTSNS